MHGINFRFCTEVIHVMQTGNVLKALFGHPTQRAQRIRKSGVCRRYSYGAQNKTYYVTG